MDSEEKTSSESTAFQERIKNEIFRCDTCIQQG